MNIKVKFCYFLLTFLNCYLHANNFRYIIPLNFDKGMESKSIWYKKKYSNKYNKNILNHLKKLYTRNFYTKLKKPNKVKIPKIIHQIWVGPKKVPNYLKKFQKTWQKLHPGWKYILWTNEKISNLKLIEEFKPEHKRLYLNANKDVREKSDILRYYLLYWYGGLYVDADFECFASFEKLHFYYDFYVGISGNKNREMLANGLIGSIPKHPILKFIINNIKNIKLKDWRDRSGVFYFSKQLERLIFSQPGINIALPTNVLYSYPALAQYNVNTHKTEYSMAIHYWANVSNWNKKTLIKLN